MTETVRVADGSMESAGLSISKFYLFICFRSWKLKRELAKLVIKWKDIYTLNCDSDQTVTTRQTLHHVSLSNR